jgi:hypothetical protein
VLGVAVDFFLFVDVGGGEEAEQSVVLLHLLLPTLVRLCFDARCSLSFIPPAPELLFNIDCCPNRQACAPRLFTSLHMSDATCQKTIITLLFFFLFFFLLRLSFFLS